MKKKLFAVLLFASVTAKAQTGVLYFADAKHTSVCITLMNATNTTIDSASAYWSNADSAIVIRFGSVGSQGVQLKSIPVTGEGWALDSVDVWQNGLLVRPEQLKPQR